MKRLLLMLVLAGAALGACSPSGSSADPSVAAPTETVPAVSVEPSAAESGSPAP